MAKREDCPATRITSATGNPEDEYYEICLDVAGHTGLHDWDAAP